MVAVEEPSQKQRSHHAWEASSQLLGLLPLVSAMGLAKEGEVLAKEGKVWAKEGEVLAKEGKVWSKQGEVLAKEGKVWSKQGEVLLLGLLPL